MAHIDLATVALLGALQSFMLAPLLLAATRAYTGVARTSLRIWGTVLLLQAFGWLLTGLRGHVDAWLSIVLANGLLIISYALTIRALRLLLHVPPRLGLLAVIGVACWSGITWFAVVAPAYPPRVYIATLSVGAYLVMLTWPLRRALRSGGSSAQRVMLLVLLAAVLTWCWRLAELLAGGAASAGLLTYSPANAANMIYSAVEPVLATIGFLLIYNEEAQAELHRLARIDPLTGVLNRLALDEEAARLFRHAAAHAGRLAALMIDTDHFKQINDRFGHADGDRVLSRLAACLGKRLRPTDTLGRIGGEEFLVLLAGADAAEATAVAERLRADVAAMEPMPHGAPGITVSIGVATRVPGDADVHALVLRADRALYEAKRSGRNRVAAAADS